MLLPEELAKKVRRIEMTTRKIVNEVMTGQYKSQFKGQGVQFSEHRIYSHGDDIRHIDWKASARSRDLLVKKFDEERELSVLFVVDVSQSEDFGSHKKLKVEIAAEIAGMLAYAAIHTGDRVGLLMFAGKVEKIVPPRKGQKHILRIIREVLGYQATTQGSQLNDALEAAGRIMKHSGVIFVISDFLTTGYEFQLKRLSKRHDVVSIWISDEREQKIPGKGWYLFSDPETGEESYVDVNSYAFKKWFEEFQKTHLSQTERNFKTSKVELLKIQTKEDYGETVVRFFHKRSRRKRA